ncbi:NUDIX hydrolase [Clostridium thermarum]|uniref:NUDIX hydrolase n=1 Tax=Clostridium thermarum TaxID=1716543 RepID=UPI00111E898B|nr:NUDIX domain-containing protein [Clostridium thermarum]
MLFNYEIGLKEFNPENMKINHREAVRAVIIRDNKLLMVHSNKGDYKFPGGGINSGESYEEALKREVREETGYIINNIKARIGTIISRNIDEYEENAVFEMISNYYLCEVSEGQTHQQLDDYEANLEFCPKWMTLGEVIHLNEEILKQDNIDKNPWVYRENLALKALSSILNCKGNQ